MTYFPTHKSGDGIVCQFKVSSLSPLSFRSWCWRSERKRSGEKENVLGVGDQKEREVGKRRMFPSLLSFFLISSNT
jgi:hypothetical protein